MQDNHKGKLNVAGDLTGPNLSDEESRKVLIDADNFEAWVEQQQ